MAEVDRTFLLNDATGKYISGAEVKAARDRLATRSVADWADLVRETRDKLAATQTAVVGASTEYRAASLNAAQGGKGATEAQGRSLKNLRTAEQKVELLQGRLTAAEAELAAAENADATIRGWEAARTRMVGHEANKAELRGALEFQRKVLKALVRSHDRLQKAAQAVSGSLPLAHHERNPLANVLQQMLIVYASAGVLPFAYAAGQYDKFRGQFASNPHSHRDPAPPPTFESVFGKFAEAGEVPADE